MLSHIDRTAEASFLSNTRISNSFCSSAMAKISVVEEWVEVEDSTTRTHANRSDKKSLTDQNQSIN